MSTYTWDGNNLKLSEHYLYGSSSLQVDKTIDELKTNGYGTLLGSRHFELTNHLGNVQAVISDNRNPQSSGTFTYYIPDIKESSDYYPFGMLMPGRNYNASAYKFGFNGKENDNEVMGITGALQDYGMRQYNSLIARFVSVDPITKDYPELTPFQFAGNTPIWAVDLDGLEPDFLIDKYSGKLTKPVISLLNSSFQYEINTMMESRWIFYKESNFGQLWFKLTQHPVASVAGSRIFHDFKNYSSSDWLGLIVHEESHRQDLSKSNSLSFYSNYILEGLFKGYRGINTEIKAYAMGSDDFNPNDLADQLLKYKQGLVLNILQNNELTSEQQEIKLHNVGLNFRAEIILGNQIKNLKLGISKLESEIKSYKGENKNELKYLKNTLDMSNEILRSLINEQNKINEYLNNEN